MTQFIDAHKDAFGVEPICRALAVAPSTYYAVKARQRYPSARALRDAELLVEIGRVYEKTRAGCTARGRCGGSCAGTASRRRAARWSG